MSFCRFEYLFNFDSMFEIHDDIEVLKRMGMACGLEVGKCSPEDLKVARSLVPKALEPYVIGQYQIHSIYMLLVGILLTTERQATVPFMLHYIKDVQRLAGKCEILCT